MESSVMRLQTMAILTLAMLAGWEIQDAIAKETSPPTPLLQGEGSEYFVPTPVLQVHQSNHTSPLMQGEGSEYSSSTPVLQVHQSNHTSPLMQGEGSKYSSSTPVLQVHQSSHTPPYPLLQTEGSSHTHTPPFPRREGGSGGLGPIAQTILVNDILIRFVNDQGEQVNGRTNKNFLLGELRLKPGQVFRESLLESDLRKLRRYEFVDKVNVSVESDANGVIVIYNIKERRYPSLNFGGGYNQDIGIYGTVGYRDANIGGLNQQLGSRLQVSREDVQFDLQFTDPYRASEPNRLGYSVRAFRRRTFSRTFGEEIDLPNDDDPREGRFGASVAALRSFKDWNAALGLNYTRISVRDDNWRVSPVDELGNPLSLSGRGIDDLVTVSFSVSRDKRDRRSYPRRGSILTLSTEQSIPIGLGNALINRLQANYIHYVPIDWIGKGKSEKYPELAEMLAFNLQAGTILGDFPPAEAFNLGGMNSVRGYGGGGVATGRSYVQGSVEYRFPIVWRFGGAVFGDFASDLGSADTVIGEPGIVRDKPGAGFGLGFGLRAKSPIGLIRADFSVNDEGGSRFEITTGQRF